MNTPVATLFGEEISDIPADLFIPPDALIVVLRRFEGPLDLLLYLIRRQNIDVLDIPVGTVTEQYLAYIAGMESGHMDTAAEYLLMAAVLTEIKARMLLPRPPASDEEETDPRAALVRRLLLYEQMKANADRLDALPRAGRDFLWAILPVTPEITVAAPTIDTDDLSAAFARVLRRARRLGRHTVVPEKISLRERMVEVLRRLQSAGRLRFENLFDVAGGVGAAVATFVALLELVKEGLVEVSQSEETAPIYVRRADNREDDPTSFRLPVIPSAASEKPRTPHSPRKPCP